MLHTAKSWAMALPPLEARKTPRFFSAAEARRIIAAAREPYATIHAVAAMTGMRAGELLGLKDSHRQAVEKLFTALDISWPQMATNGLQEETKGQLIQ